LDKEVKTMRAKFLYALLILAVVALVAAAGILMQMLFSMSVEEPQPVAAEGSHPIDTASTPSAPPVPISETVIDVGGEPEPEPSSPAKAKEPSISSSSPDVMVAAKDTVVGTVVYLKGDAVLMRDEEKPVILALHSRISLNDRIETSAGAKVKIQFSDGSTMSQGENSVTVIDEYMYNPGKKAESNFAMRFVKGAARVVTGKITQVNPNRFKVKTRMATIGIRGCDLCFKSDKGKDDVLVLELSEGRTIMIDTTTDGSPVMDPKTGRQLQIDDIKRDSVEVTEERTLVSILEGEGATQRRVSLDEIREIITEASHLPPVRFGLLQRPDGAVLTLQREEKKPPDRALDRAK
jgi:hypothetical protein